MVTDREIDRFITIAFESNFDFLQQEAGHSINEELKRTALNQVLIYWRKLRDLVFNVTEAEVRLILPNNLSPSGKQFNIQGVVDIVEGIDKTTMYEIKTHTVEVIQANLQEYQKQLNIYAFIWGKLRDRPLDNAAIIATSYPEDVKRALISGNEGTISQALKQWNPVIQFQPKNCDIDVIISEFGVVVDCIEEHKFTPPEFPALEKPYGRIDKPFGYVVCRNCDGRFSCSSYREFLERKKQGGGLMSTIFDGKDLDEIDDWLVSDYEFEE